VAGLGLSMPKRLTKQALAIPLDEVSWNKLYHQYQQEYLRTRLRFVKLLYQLQEQQLVGQRLGLSNNTIHSWTQQYVDFGLTGWIQPRSHPNPQQLSPGQKQELARIIVNQIPTDYGFDRYLWTGEILEQLLQQKFNVKLKDSRIYQILHELGLSHQKAHRDYDNANSESQTQFQYELKKNLNPNKIWSSKDKR
jgi:transposase